MLENVLLFRRGDLCHDSLNCWSEMVAEQLVKRNVRVHELSLVQSNEERDRQLIDIISSVHIDAAIAFNAFGQQDYKLSSGENLWDSIGTEFFNYIVDHPLEHCDDLRSECRNYHVICVDQYHADFVRRCFPNVKSASFLPLAGLGTADTKTDRFEDFMSREYDVVLTAGLRGFKLMKSQLFPFQEDVQDIALSWTDYMEHHLDESPELALRSVLEKKLGVTEPVPDETYLRLAEMCSEAVPYIRTWVRKRVVESLIESGLQFHIWGEGWEDICAEHPDLRVTLHKDIPIKETAELYRRTKLAINIMPMFKWGLHDRIATAQINGAAVITDTNAYLEGIYPPGSIYSFRFDETERLAHRIETILADKEKLYQVAINGQLQARRKLTWNEAGETLFEILTRETA